MHRFQSTHRSAVAALFGAGIAVLAGCSSVGGGVGFGIPLAPGLSIGVGFGSGGPSIGIGTGWGPVGAGVSVNQVGQVIGSAGLGVGVGSGNVGAGIGVGQSVVLHDPNAPPPINAYEVTPTIPAARPGDIQAP